MLAAVFCFGLASCSQGASLDGADTTGVRVALSPAPGTIPAAGADFEAVVIMHQGPTLNVPWTVSIDGDTAWLLVETKTITTHFVGTYSGDDRDVEQPGISCTVAPNMTGRKRSATLRFTAENGASTVFVINQAAK